MVKFDKKAILSAKDSVKNASDKLTKIALDMGETDVAPSPEQVKEISESIAAVAMEIVQQADTISEGLEQVTSEPPIEDSEKDKDIVEGNVHLDDETKEKLARLEEDNDDLKKFKETSEKEKMATTYANLFDAKVRSAKFTEFMKMDKPNSELSTVLGATENALKSVTKVASMHKSNETIIFKESTQKNASMSGLSSSAKSLSEI